MSSLPKRRCPRSRPAAKSRGKGTEERVSIGAHLWRSSRGRMTCRRYSWTVTAGVPHNDVFPQFGASLPRTRCQPWRSSPGRYTSRRQISSVTTWCAPDDVFSAPVRSVVAKDRMIDESAPGVLRHGVPPDDVRLPTQLRRVVAKDTVFSRDEARE